MPDHALTPRRLLVVSHVVHYRHDGRLHAYGPYAREIDIWADLFPQIMIAAPCRDEVPPGDCLAFTRANIDVHQLPETGGHTAKAKVQQLVKLPALTMRLIGAMRSSDAIHVRCPGNVGLVGAVLAPLFSRRLIAKYANQWNGYAEEPWTVRAQRQVLRSRWWKGPVTVYGGVPGDPPHVVPFFTSMMTAEQVRHAADVAARRSAGQPLRVLFVGRLAASKRVDALLAALKIAAERGIDVEATIVGDGPERGRLEELAASTALRPLVRFAGAVEYDAALEWYEWGDCLVLPSRHSEGWPKVIAEAMSYGVVCVAVAHGHVGDMVKGRGVLLTSGEPSEIADALAGIARDRERHRDMAMRAAAWSSGYSLEGLRDALDELLKRTWKIPAHDSGT
jgi:glycosyltransferase involved in cell wall biosynthesis